MRETRRGAAFAPLTRVAIKDKAAWPHEFSLPVPGKLMLPVHYCTGNHGRAMAAAQPHNTSRATQKMDSEKLRTLLGGSSMLQTLTGPSITAAFAEAIAPTSFTVPEATRLLTVLAEADRISFPSAGDDFNLLFLAPVYPSPRVLSVAEEARAWVLADYLCVDKRVMQRLEMGIVQRYMEDTAQLPDWRAALAVDGYPSADTLWALVTEKHAAALRSRFTANKSLGLPHVFGQQLSIFGEQQSDAERSNSTSMRKGISLAALSAISLCAPLLMGTLYPPVLATLLHQSDEAVLKIAIGALKSFGSGELFFDGYAAALSRMVDSTAVVLESCSKLESLSLHHCNLWRLHRGRRLFP